MPPSFINMTSKERRKKALKVKHNQFNHTSKKTGKILFLHTTQSQVN